MVTGAIEWYKNQFSIEEESTSQDILQHVPCVVTQEDSDLLSHMITMEESFMGGWKRYFLNLYLLISPILCKVDLSLRMCYLLKK